MNKNHILIVLALMGTIVSCASNSSKQYEIQDSYLQQSQQQPNTLVKESEDITDIKEKLDGFSSLPVMSMRETKSSNSQDLVGRFSDTEQVEMASEELPLADFLHYVLGEILKVNYILGDSAKKANQTVTLNIQQNISKQKLFSLTQELLADKGLHIRHSEDIFYINSEESAEGKSTVAFGYGINASSVPNTSVDILQIVPFKYGLRSNLSLILPSIAKVKVTPDNEQNSAMLRGKRSDILKALEFIQLIDTPGFRHQSVAAYKSTFVPVKELITKLELLLKNDGYSGGVSTVPLDAQSTLILFSADSDLMSRAKFWLKQLDVPADNDEKHYFVFQPLYARATDLTESLAPLLGGGQSSLQNTSKASGSGESQQSSSTSKRSGIKSASNEDVSIVVDARSNSLIVHSSGKDYRAILPLIERLDVLPKQVMLEVLIAEVTLKDEFAQGVEFFLDHNNYTLGNLGSFGVDGIGGLSYILTGSNKWNVNASLSQTNSLINIVSRPTLVVRDGVTADMQVGTDIPIVSSTSSPDVGTTSSVQYRKTGLNLSVTPTVNSRGVVIMEINQQISNVVIDSKAITAEGAPSIFTRSMKTEVVANSGQTVILGGLISENNTKSDSEVPGLSQIPILGHLFASKSDVKDKTELVIMVTPRIIESAQQWSDVKAAMAEQLEQIKLTNQEADISY
ncbi:secretin N-terminal domain-containing protein [Alteromonadaceae bacterium BrNp21-10]|nr:secretin N-terminal domain-containing protein [Alteromonadaceae bacterium BrNp21-10]